MACWPSVMRCAISPEGMIHCSGLLCVCVCVAVWLLVHRSGMSVLVTVVAGFKTTWQWYDTMGIRFFYLLAWCIGDWASERYCDHMVCLCVCLPVNPNSNDVLGIRQYMAKYRYITIPPKLGRYKINSSIAKLYGNVYMWVGVARMLHNSDVTIVTSTVTSQIVTSSVTSQQWRHQWRHNVSYSMPLNIQTITTRVWLTSSTQKAV